MEIEHALVDYLNGDDCSVNPWIGYNPTKWDITEKTFEHLKMNHTFRTGSDENTEIRKYRRYFEKPYVNYRKLIVDETGDTCPFVIADPFTDRIDASGSTDGLQFDQYPGKTQKGDTKIFIDPNVQRPLEIVRKSTQDYKFKNIEVNDYVMDFQTKIVCDKGLYMRNGIDMTSFFQMKSVVTKPRYDGIDEPGLILPKITYTHPLERDSPPVGITANESYFVIEPYSGIVFKYEKKMMTSLAIYYDELYGKLPDGGLGELLPYYSMYETMRVSDAFAKFWEDSVNSALSTRRAIAITFTILGLLFVITAFTMVVRAFYFKAEPEAQLAPAINDSLIKDTQGEPLNLNIDPIKQKLMVEPDEQPKENKEIAQETKS